MANSKVLAVKDVKFTDDKTGELVVGRQLWTCTPSKDPDWNGYIVEKNWFREDHELYDWVRTLEHDQLVMLEYNGRGKLEDIVLV